MGAAMITSVLLLVLLSACAGGKVITVDDSQTLENYICGKSRTSLTHGTTLQLSAAEYNLNFTQYNFCLLENLMNLTITSSSPTTIKCVTDEGGGIGFFNMSGLRLVNLQLISCGAGIPTDVLQYVNDSDASPLYVVPEQKAVLVLNHCTNVQLCNISISSFSGFGLLAVNLVGKSMFEYLQIYGNTNKAMFYFFNSAFTGSNHSNVDVIIREAKFQWNKYKHQESRQYFDISKLYSKRETSLPLVGSAGVSFIFAQNYTVNITMNNSWSNFNIGRLAGGAFILFLKYFGYSTLNIQHFTMTDNWSSEQTGICGMLVHFASTEPQLTVTTALENWVPLTITNSTFARNAPPAFETSNKLLSHRAMAIFQYVKIASNSSIILRNVSFYNNTSQQDSTCSCLCASFVKGGVIGVSLTYGLNLYLEDIVTTNNGNGYVTSSNGLFSFKGIETVKIVGERGCVFSDNYGSVIKARLTAVHLQGNLTFTNNRGLQGAVFQLAELAYLVLMEPLNATFTHNRAFYYGGVLYSYTTSVDTDSICPIQAYKSVTSLDQIALNFINNSALKSGNSIRAYPFYNCTHLNENVDVSLFHHGLFNFIENASSPFPNQTALNEVSSKAEKVCICKQDNGISRPDCNATLPPLTVFAGSKVNLSICGIDAANVVVRSSVIIRLYNYTSIDSRAAAHIHHEEQAQVLLENTCTQISVTILRNSDDDDDDDVNMTLTTSLLGEQPSYQFNVTIQPCPTGFVLDQGFCVCDPRLRDLGPLTCQVDDRSVAGLHRGVWLGLVNGTVGYSSACQVESCNPQTTTVNLSLPDDICLNNRSGIMCGDCQENLSAVLGSYQCLPCPNYGPIYIIPLFALAGIVLVVLLMALRITVSSGTIVGLIFYANISQTNLLPYIPEDHWLFLRVIISFLNLNLGIPLCLFNGMTTLHKGLLQFVFPVYLWLILLVIVLISRYSTTISRLLVHNVTMQVFATLLFLSYSSLTNASLFALIPTTVHIGNKTELVWFFNGNVQYFSFAGGHIFLAILAIIILMLFVLPYTVLATVGVCMMRFSCFAVYFKPLVDAHHAPYKDKWHFWFGLRLWVMLYAITVYLASRQTGSSYVRVLDLIVLIPFLLLQAYLHPYKNRALNMLDLFLMTNLTMTIVILSYVPEQFKQIFAVISAGITFVAFLFILAYHVYWTYLCSRCLHYIGKMFSPRHRQRHMEQQSLLQSQTIPSDTTESAFKKIERANIDKNKFRESLLNFADEI